MLATREIAIVNVNTRQSMLTEAACSPMRGMPPCRVAEDHGICAGYVVNSHRMLSMPRPSPQTAPASCEHRAFGDQLPNETSSTGADCRANRHFAARPAPRMSRRLATFAHAINNTKTTAPCRTASQERTSPTMASRTGWTLQDIFGPRKSRPSSGCVCR